MANQNSAAYDFARFEPKRREEAAQQQQKNNVIQLPQEKLDKNARPRFQPARVILMLAVLSVTLATVGSLVFGQVQLTELTDAINNSGNAACGEPERLHAAADEIGCHFECQFH